MKRIFLTLIALSWSFAVQAEIAIQEVTSKGGISAWLVEDHNIPFTAIELRFKGGTNLDLPQKRGATNLMMALLEEGTGDLDARGFAAARDSLAASFRYNAGDDAVAVSARFLTENREQAVELLRKSLIEPNFDQSAIDRVRGQVISGLRSDESDPDAIAGRAFDKIAYGDHPYGTSGDGTIETVTALTRDDILTAHKNSLVRDRVYVGAVGDISPEELGALLDTLLGALPQSGPDLPKQVEFKGDGGTQVIDFDTPQSVAIFAQKGIAMEDKDFFPAYVMTEILGAGGFESRLMDEVREKRGLTYGIYAYLAARDYTDIMLGRFASSNDRMKEAIDVVRSEWRKMAQDGVTQDELDRTKTYLTGSYPLRFDGNGTIANIMVGMQMQGLPADYIRTRNDKINAVTLEDVNRVAKTLLDPDHLQFVVVGRPEGLN